MKAESLVIVDQHAAVNGLRPCTHRPSRQGRGAGLKVVSIIKARVLFRLFRSLNCLLFFAGVTDGQRLNRDEVVTR